MALDRLLPVSATPGAITGNSYMDSVQEEVTGLWNRSVITLTGVSGTNTILAAMTPALSGGLVDGMCVILPTAGGNTTAVTLNINSGGANTVADAEGSALAAGALRSGARYLLTWNSGSSKWVVVNYTPAAAVANGLIRIKTLVASSSVFNFVNGVSGVVLDGTYSTYEIIFSNIKPTTDAVNMYLRIGTGGGPTYQITNYRWFNDAVADNSPGISNNTSDNAMYLTHTTGGAQIGSGFTYNGRMLFHNPATQNVDRSHFQWVSSYATNTGVIVGVRGAGFHQGTVSITGLEIGMSSGTIASGRATLYGWTIA